MSSPDERIHLVVAEDLNGVARLGADLFVALARKAAAVGHEFAVALSGGSTPKLMHRLLAGDPYRTEVEWSRVQFYWGDDRHVAPDDPDSNFRMARETLLDAVPLREEQIHRMHTEEADARVAADLYE
ncbi:MAG TPA: 6-phosphogluconolactonase, partial [Ktedonobacterales bacterium]|nr:6-phosphogluconolactonase [Ktedonobacterales bacterium]